MSKILDNNINKETIKKLQELGLSEKEALVYFALLPKEDVGSSKIIQATGLHGQFVYNALEKLEELGLARHVIQKGRKKFSANNPSRLLLLIEEKRFAAQAISKELQSRFVGDRQQDFEVYRGEAAFVAHHLDLLRRAPQNSMLDVVASETERFQKTFESCGRWDEYLKLQKEKQIKIRYLGSEVQREQLQRREQREPLWTHCIFPGHSIGIISIEIHTEVVAFIVYSDPILCFTLMSKDVAEGYRHFFDAVWALANK